MTDRRQFLRRLGGLTGTAALVELTGVRDLFAADLGRSVSRIGSRGTRGRWPMNTCSGETWSI